MKKITPILMLFFFGCNFTFNFDLNDPEKRKNFTEDKTFHYLAYFISGDDTTTVNVLLGLENKKYPDSQQFAIYWKSFEIDDADTIIEREWTGAIDNDTRFWIHPPRMGRFEILSFAPFPEIKQNGQTGGFSKESLIMNKSYKGKRVFKVNITQVHNKDTIIHLPNLGVVEGKFYDSYSESNLGKILHYSVLNDSLGWLYSHYFFPDNEELIIELQNVDIEENILFNSEI